MPYGPKPELRQCVHLVLAQHGHLVWKECEEKALFAKAHSLWLDGWRAILSSSMAVHIGITTHGMFLFVGFGQGRGRTVNITSTNHSRPVWMRLEERETS